VASSPLPKKGCEERGKAREGAIEEIQAGEKVTPGSLFSAPASPEIREEWGFEKSVQGFPRVLLAHEIDFGDPYRKASRNHLFIPAIMR
jgi:hypothetical protein